MALTCNSVGEIFTFSFDSMCDEQEAGLTAKPHPQCHQLIGRWLTNYPPLFLSLLNIKSWAVSQVQKRPIQLLCDLFFFTGRHQLPDSDTSNHRVTEHPSGLSTTAPTLRQVQGLCARIWLISTSHSNTAIQLPVWEGIISFNLPIFIFIEWSELVKEI